MLSDNLVAKIDADEINTTEKGSNMDKVESFYDKMSATYDHWMKTGESTLEDELALVLKTFPSPCRILDVGCGTGRISLPLQQLGYSVVGVDISEGMVAEAKRKGISEAFVADFASFEYQDNAFNAIISLHAGFSYTHDPAVMRAMIEKTRNLLDCGGRVLWDSPNYEFYGQKKVLQWPSQSGLLETTCFGHDMTELIDFFEQGGFTVNHVWGSYTPLQEYGPGLPRIIIEAEHNE
jgi:SAM-dependent methyltransferase